MSTRIPPAGFELHGYSLIEPLPHETGELEAPVWLAEENGTLDQVLIATLGTARLGVEARQAMYDRCLRFSGIDHPALPDYLDSTSPENPDCFVAWAMPPAAPLRDRLNRARGDLGFALRFLSSAARALSALHDAGEVHGALCPALLAVGDRDRAFLLAAGLGSLVLDEPSLLVASRYRAPEQLVAPGGTESPSPEVGPAADVWALGVLLYELVEGKTPQAGATIEEVRREALALERLSLGALPEAPQLDEILARSIAPDPAGRFADAGEMADRLDELRQHLEARTVAQKPVEPVESPTAAAAGPLVVSTPLDPSWRPSPGARRIERASPPEGGVPVLLWLVPAALLLALAAFLLWWVGVL